MLLLMFANTATSPNSLKGQVRVQTPNGMVIKPLKVWMGASWVIKPAKVWDGSKWVLTFNTDPPVLTMDTSDPGTFYGRGLVPDPDEPGTYFIYDNAVQQDPNDDQGIFTTGG